MKLLWSMDIGKTLEANGICIGNLIQMLINCINILHFWWLVFWGDEPYIVKKYLAAVSRWFWSLIQSCNCHDLAWNKSFLNPKRFFTPHSPSCFLVHPFLTIMFAILPGPNFSFLQLAIVLPLWSRSFTDPSPWSVDWTSKYTSPSRSTTLNQILVDDSFQEIKHFTCSLHHSLSAWAQCSLSANIFLSASECPVVLELLEPQ